MYTKHDIEHVTVGGHRRCSTSRLFQREGRSRLAGDAKGQRPINYSVAVSGNAAVDALQLNAYSRQILDAAFKVHSALGPGLLEHAYEACLAYELRSQGLRVETQYALPIVYDGHLIDLAYKADLLVENCILVELKTVRHLLPVHEAQLLSYLRLSNYRLGLLINFRELHLRDGISRLVNKL